jgi:hypothetical protein
MRLEVGKGVHVSTAVLIVQMMLVNQSEPVKSRFSTLVGHTSREFFLNLHPIPRNSGAEKRIRG